MCWWIILGILIIGVIVGIIIFFKSRFHNTAGIVISIISGLFAIMFGIFIIDSAITIPKDTHTYVMQKQYIEQCEKENNNSIKNAALTSKKVELNEWLYNAQYEYKYYREWVMYPNYIKDLKPIN